MFQYDTFALNNLVNVGMSGYYSCMVSKRNSFKYTVSLRLREWGDDALDTVLTRVELYASSDEDLIALLDEHKDVLDFDYTILLKEHNQFLYSDI